MKNDKTPKGHYLNQDKGLYQTPLFWLALVVPILLGSFIAFRMGASEETVKLVSSAWTMYKIPLAIASLCMPLVAWVIANHRSTQTIKGLELQREKRLFDMYYEKQKHFEKVIGRRLITSKFKYIQNDDLPVIFSELYEFNHLHNKGVVSLSENAIPDVERFLRETKKLVVDFCDHFEAESEKAIVNENILDSLIDQFFNFLQARIYDLSMRVGARNVGLSDCTVDIFCCAYFEVKALIFYIGSETEESEEEAQRVHKVFTNAKSLITKHVGGEANYNQFIDNARIKAVLKQVNASPLENVVTKFSHEIIQKLQTEFKFFDVIPTNGAYPKFQLLKQEGSACLELWFEKKSENVGLLWLSGGVEDLSVHIAMEGGESNRYLVGKDLGETFLSDAKVIVAGFLK